MIVSKRIRVQASQPIDQSLVKRLSDFVTEVTILLDPLQNQIGILQYWRCYVERKGIGDLAILGMYDEAIKARETHLCAFRRLLDQGNHTQALVSISPSQPAPVRARR